MRQSRSASSGRAHAHPSPAFYHRPPGNAPHFPTVSRSFLSVGAPQTTLVGRKGWPVRALGRPRGGRGRPGCASPSCPGSALSVSTVSTPPGCRGTLTRPAFPDPELACFPTRFGTIPSLTIRLQCPILFQGTETHGGRPVGPVEERRSRRARGRPSRNEYPLAVGCSTAGNAGGPCPLSSAAVETPIRLDRPRATARSAGVSALAV
jgi:hypothetical protein